MNEGPNSQQENYTSAFDCEKEIQLNNCEKFHVRMFSPMGERKFVAVSLLPHNKQKVVVSTKNQEFSLYDSKGREQCVIIFPQSRYQANQEFAEKNAKNHFQVEWKDDMNCTITYLKKSHKTLKIIGLLLLFYLFYLLFV